MVNSFHGDDTRGCLWEVGRVKYYFSIGWGLLRHSTNREKGDSPRGFFFEVANSSCDFLNLILTLNPVYFQQDVNLRVIYKKPVFFCFITQSSPRFLKLSHKDDVGQRFSESCSCQMWNVLPDYISELFSLTSTNHIVE